MQLECATIEFLTKEMTSHRHDRLVLSLRGDPPKVKKLPVDESAIKDLLKQLFRAYPEVAVQKGVVPSGDRPERAQGAQQYLTVIQIDGSKVDLSATEDMKKSLLGRLIDANFTRARNTWLEEHGAEYRRGEP